MNEVERQTILNKLLIYCGVPMKICTSRIDNNEQIGSFFFTGNIGSGKTYKAVGLLANWMVNSKLEFKTQDNGNVIPRYFSCIFITVPELLLSIRNCFRSDSRISEVDIINKYANAPFLILDDMGVEKVSEWSLQTLYIIINRRYDNPEAVTIITSNLTLDELGVKFNDRIASRINGMCKTVIFKGKDRRMNV